MVSKFFNFYVKYIPVWKMVLLLSVKRNDQKFLKICETCGNFIKQMK